VLEHPVSSTVFISALLVYFVQNSLAYNVNDWLVFIIYETWFKLVFIFWIAHLINMDIGTNLLRNFIFRIIIFHILRSIWADTFHDILRYIHFTHIFRIRPFQSFTNLSNVVDAAFQVGDITGATRFIVIFRRGIFWWILLVVFRIFVRFIFHYFWQFFAIELLVTVFNERTEFV